MASAYELMLVLRGRNYLSNDLRRAGADLRGLKAASALTNQRSQLQVNAQRLASTRAIAQAEIDSLSSGSRSVALKQRQLALTTQQETVGKKLLATQTELTASQDAQIANAERLAAVQKEMAVTPARSLRSAQLLTQQEALLKVDKDLIAEQLRLADSLAIQEAAVAKLDLAEQKLIASYVEAAARQAVLTDRINTTSAAEGLNTIKLNENALAMKRLPLEALGARAKYVEHLGRTFQTFGLIAVAAIGLAAHAAAKFQTSGVLAATQLTNAGNNSPIQLQRIGANINKQLLDFMASGRSVSSSQELQKAAYDIPSGIPSLRGSSTQKAKETIALIKEFNQVAKANYGLVDLNGVTNAGIILINTFGTSIARLPHEFDVMQSAVNRGKVTLGEFVSGLSQTAPAAKAAGYNFDSMSATLSFLSGKLPQYTRVAVGYARALELFQNKKFEDYMKSKGAAITDLTGKLLPYNQIIGQLLKVDPQLAKAGNLIAFLKTASGASGFMQARRVLTVSLQDQAGLDKATRVVPANAQGLVNKSAQALSQTGAVKWKELTTQLKALTIEIGDGAIPAFQRMAKPIESVVHWFEQLSPHTKDMIGKWAALSATGLLLGGTLLTVVGMFGRIYVALRLLTIGKAGVAGLEAGSLSAGAALRLGLIGALILAIPLIIKYHDGIMRVINAMGGLTRVVTAAGFALGAWKIAGILNNLKLLSWMAGGAAGKVFGLQKALAALAVLGPIAIPIIITILFKKQVEDIAHSISNELSKIPLIGGAFKDSPKSFAEIMAAKKAAEKAAGLKALSQAQAITDKISSVFNIFSNTPHDPAPHDITKKPVIPTIPVNAPTTSKEINTAIANIVKLDKIATSSHRYQDYLKAAAALKALQDKVGKDQFAAAQQVISALESIDEKHTKKTISNAQKRARAAAKAAKDAVAAAQKEVTQAAQTLQGEYSSTFSQNQSAFGSLFAGPFSQSAPEQNKIQWGGKLTGKDLLHDLRSQVAQFKRWRGLLNRLVKMGVPFALLQQIEAAGPASIDNVTALLSLSKADLRSYFKTFESAEGPNGLLQVATKQDMTLQLKQYRKYGRNIALQIIQGLKDENTPMLKYFESMIMSMFPGLAKDAKGHAATLTKGHAATKTQPAVHDPAPHALVPRKPKSSRTTQSAGSVTHHTENNTYVVHADPKSDIRTQLLHAHFTQRNRSGLRPK